MIDFLELQKRIRPVDLCTVEQAREHLKAQTRPERSLGFLEDLVSRISGIQRTLEPTVEKKILFVFASDHGVAEEGVSLYPQEVTAQMVANFLRGGATINSFARQAAVDLKIVDVGVRFPIPGTTSELIQKKVALGTRNFTQGPAMSEQELQESIQIGIDLVREAKEHGYELIGTGEMGIANTTSASAVAQAVTGATVEEVTGRGTGIGPELWQHKVEVIRRALEMNRKFLNDPLGILQALGGFEIAAITGVAIGCALEEIPCVVDGLISCAGAAIAMEWHPGVRDYLFFGHRSYEKGHSYLLSRYGGRPILDLDLRLGEGTGACLAMWILEAMVKAFNEVATFEEASVSNRKDQERVSVK